MIDYIKMRNALTPQRGLIDEAIVALERYRANRCDVFKTLEELRKQHAAVVEAIAVIERIAQPRGIKFDAAGKQIVGRGGWKWSKEARAEASKRAKERHAKGKPQPAVS